MPLEEIELDILKEFLSKKRGEVGSKLHLSKISRARLAEIKEICDSYNKTPFELVEFVFNSLGKRKAYFNLYHLCDLNTHRLLTQERTIKTERGSLVSSTTIPLQDLLRHLKTLLYSHCLSGAPEEEVLEDPSIDFPAWFRILATQKSNSRIISTYLEQAKKEVHGELLNFLKEENLPLTRIFS
jgi:hypothetical protein